MTAKRLRHLAVHDESGAIVGALTARDLLKQRAGSTVSLGDAIHQAESPEELIHVWSSLTTVVRGLVLEEVDPRDIAGIISRELRGITKRACELAEDQMQRSGNGPPPCHYALMVLGSGGRGESLLAMDQDNALIFERGEPDGMEDAWFAELGRLTADALDKAGVPYCTGGVMASEPAWRMDEIHWAQQVDTWMSKSRPDDLLHCDIFFDAVPVHGALDLANGLIDRARATAAHHRPFIQAMSRKAGEFRPALNWLGKPKTENGRIDLKMHGILPIFSTARALALRYDISARSTPDRLAALAAHDDTSRHALRLHDLVEAHRILLGEILKQQLRDIDSGEKLSNRVELDALDSHHKTELTWALEQIESTRTLLDLPDFG